MGLVLFRIFSGCLVKRVKRMLMIVVVKMYFIVFCKMKNDCDEGLLG